MYLLILISPIFYLIGFIYFIFLASYIFFISILFGLSILYHTIPFLCRLQLFTLGVWLKLEGRIPKDQCYIIVMNHSSFIDVFLIGPPLRGKYTALLADFNFNIPIWNRLLKKMNMIPIYRDRHNKAIEAIEKAQKIIKDYKYHVIILPEGTRTLDGNLQQFKKGAFHMAINTNTPIIPIVTKGAFEYKPKNRWYIKPGIIKAKVGKPISQNEYLSLGVDGLLKKTHQQMKKMLEDM